MSQRPESFHQVLNFSQIWRCVREQECIIFTSNCEWSCIWNLLQFKQTHSCFFIAAEGSDTCHTVTFRLSQGVVSTSKWESLSLSHFPLPLWITKQHLILQVLLERICISYYSSALNIVATPVSSTAYFVTTFSALLSNGDLFSCSQENNLSLWPAGENKSPVSPLCNSQFTILISLPMKFYLYR